jgi:MFS family permease
MSATRAVTGTRQVPRTVKGLSLVSLFNDFASEMVYPLLPALVTLGLGGGAVALGALDGAADLTSAALKLVSGRLADRPGWRRPLILVGYLTAVLVRPLISVAGAAWQVIGFRVIDRVGKGIRTAPRDALIADITPQPLHGRAFGFHRGADHFGAVLGSLAAWLFLESGADVREVIGWSFVPGLVACTLLAGVLRTAQPVAKRTIREAAAAGRLARPTAPGHGPQPADDRPGARPLGGAPITDSTGRVFWAPVVALGALTFSRLPEALLLLRLQQVGVAVALIPLVWAALHVVRSAASYPGGWLTDRLGSRRTVAAGGLLFAGVVATMALAPAETVTVVVFLAFGLVAGLTESAERTLVALLAPVRTGRGFGAYHALTGIAALPAALVFGAIYQRAGGAWALASSAAAMLAAVIGWLAVSPRHAGRGG